MNNTALVPPEDPANGHPIKLVAQRTGLSAHVIRMWEKRYGAITPTRTGTNRRRYAGQDIERLKLLKHAIQAGRSIGQIAHLSNEHLCDLIKQDNQAQGSVEKSDNHLHDTTYHSYITEALNAIEQLDAQVLSFVLSRAAVAFSQPLLIEQIIVPLMYQIGDLWQNGTLRVAHEHMAYAVIRAFLENLKPSYTSSTHAPCLVVATPSGQLHELGAIIVSTVAAADGWQVTYLGASLPAEEIALATLQKNARAVALSLVYPGDDPQLSIELNKLRDLLPSNVALFIGGRVVTQYQAILQNMDVFLIKNLQNLREQLQILRLTHKNQT